jgi:Zn-dependent protease
MNLFRIRGIQLAVHSSFFLLLAYVAWLGWQPDPDFGDAASGWIGVFWNVVILLAFFTCVVLHELGHSFTAMHYGVGYTGGGVGPTHLGGKILSALVLAVQDEHTALPLVGMTPMRFPPEPLLSVGATVTQRAIVRRDELEDRDRRADPLTDFVARLPRRMGYEIGP